MRIFIPARTEDRWFPAIKDSSSIDAGRPERRAVWHLLSLARHCQPWKRWGLSRQPLRRCALVLWQFDQAVRAELAGRQRRAEFFFDESSNEFGRLDGTAGAWAEIVRALDEPEAAFAKEPVQLRESLVTEHFIDTHAAFFNGYCDGGENAAPPGRAAWHLSRIQSWTERCALSPAAKYALLREPLEAKAETLAKAGDWAAAVEVIDGLQAMAPQKTRYVEQTADLYLSGAAAVLKKGEEMTFAVLDRLRWGISGLGQLRTKHPDFPSLYDQLALLHRVRGVGLAKKGDYDDALLSLSKAMVCRPEDEAAGESYRQLRSMMEEMQERLAAAKLQLRNNPNLSLNERARNLGEAAVTGLRRATAYEKSEEARNLADAREQARLRGLWRAVGLEEPASDWNRRATELIGAMSTVIENSPQDEARIEEAWRGASEGNPELTSLDGTKVCRFLASRLLGKPEPPDAGLAAALPAGEQGDAPVLHPWQGKPRGGGAPFGYWLTAPVDRVFKAGCVAAAVFLGYVTVTHLRESTLLDHRERAYTEFSTAYARGDYRAVIVAAETFFDARPKADDQREGEVIAKAQEALVRWTARQTGDVVPADRELIARLAELMPSDSSRHEK